MWERMNRWNTEYFYNSETTLRKLFQGSGYSPVGWEWL